MAALGAEPEAAPDGSPAGGAGPRRPVSKLAIAALVTGILALVPLALGLGVAALSVIRRTGRRGHGMAVAGLLLAIAWAVAGGTAGLAAVVTHGFRQKVQVGYGQDAIFTLRQGECLNGPPNGQYFTAMPCATPHDAEVFATFALPATRWPGAAALRDDAGAGCASRLSGYMNPQFANAGLSQVFVYPDQQAWAAGVRTVICEVRASSGQLTGSVRGTG